MAVMRVYLKGCVCEWLCFRTEPVIYLFDK